MIVVDIIVNIVLAVVLVVQSRLATVRAAAGVYRVGWSSSIERVELY